MFASEFDIESFNVNPITKDMDKEQKAKGYKQLYTTIEYDNNPFYLQLKDIILAKNAIYPFNSKYYDNENDPKRFNFNIDVSAHKDILDVINVVDASVEQDLKVIIPSQYFIAKPQPQYLPINKNNSITFKLKTNKSGEILTKLYIIDEKNNIKELQKPTFDMFEKYLKKDATIDIITGINSFWFSNNKSGISITCERLLIRKEAIKEQYSIPFFR